MRNKFESILETLNEAFVDDILSQDIIYEKAYVDINEGSLGKKRSERRFDAVKKAFAKADKNPSPANSAKLKKASKDSIKSSDARIYKIKTRIKKKTSDESIEVTEDELLAEAEALVHAIAEEFEIDNDEDWNDIVDIVESVYASDLETILEDLDQEDLDAIEEGSLSIRDADDVHIDIGSHDVEGSTDVDAEKDDPTAEGHDTDGGKDKGKKKKGKMDEAAQRSTGRFARKGAFTSPQTQRLERSPEAGRTTSSGQPFNRAQVTMARKAKARKLVKQRMSAPQASPAPSQKPTISNFRAQKDTAHKDSRDKRIRMRQIKTRLARRKAAGRSTKSGFFSRMRQAFKAGTGANAAASYSQHPKFRTESVDFKYRINENDEDTVTMMFTLIDESYELEVPIDYAADFEADILEHGLNEEYADFIVDEIWKDFNSND